MACVSIDSCKKGTDAELGCLVLVCVFPRAFPPSPALPTLLHTIAVGNQERKDVAGLGQALGSARLRSLGPPRGTTTCSDRGHAPLMHWHGEIPEANALSDTLSATTPVATPPPPRSAAAVEQRRARVYHACQQMRLLPTSTRAQSADRAPQMHVVEAPVREQYLTPLGSPAGARDSMPTLAKRPQHRSRRQRQASHRPPRAPCRPFGRMHGRPALRQGTEIRGSSCRCCTRRLAL